MLVIKALNFGAEKHKKQKRKCSGLPYIIHPVTVMYLISKYKGTSKHIEELMCAAILHDTLEDTDCTYLELEREFNAMVSSIVMELTNDDEIITKVGKNNYLKNKMVGMSSYVFILKLLDRLANILDNPKDQYCEDTIDLINHLLKNRPDITDRQYEIMCEIINTCESLLGCGQD